MYYATVLHGGGNFAGNLPFTFELELQRTGFVGLHCAGAQFCRQIGNRWQVKPLAGAGCARHGGRLGKHVGLKSFGLCCYQPAGEAPVFQKIAHEAWRARVFTHPLLGIDGQRIPRPGHGHIKQAPFFLFAQFLVIVLRYGSGVVQLPGEFEQRLFERRRE